MRRSDFRTAFLQGLVINGPNSDPTREPPVLYFAKGLQRKIGSRKARMGSGSVPCHPKSVDIESKTPSSPELPRIKEPELDRVKELHISPMDRDVALKKIRQLYSLVYRDQENYLENSLGIVATEASKQGLSRERNLFYKFFGATAAQQEVVTTLIAKHLDAQVYHSTHIINGLIKYFRSLAFFLSVRKDKLEKTKPKLLNKYIKYGIHEVYSLIESISKKIKTRPRIDIDPKKYLSPNVSPTIQRIFGSSVLPLEF